MAKAPVIRIAAPAPKAVASTGQAFNQFINAHPSMRGYSDAIWKWSRVYGTDPVVMAALFWRESFAAAKSTNQDPATITSPTGAGVGIGQINPNHVGSTTPWGGTVSQTDLTNPEFNIRWSTWFFSQKQAAFGTPDGAYAQGYNPGYTGAPLTSLLPKGYVPKGGLSPAQAASVGVESKAAKAAITDPWVVLGANGKLQYVKADQAPKGTISYGAQPLHLSDFNSVWKQGYYDTFYGYTGRSATGAEIKQILADAPSTYKLANDLAAKKGFAGSPTYQARGPGVAAIYEQAMGKKPPAAFVAQAIAQNWDQATLAANIKTQPGYMDGPQYKNDAATMRAVYQPIFGKPDAKGEQWIHDAAVEGWSQDAAAQALRADPSYKFSPEYAGHVSTFLDGMGLLIGARPVLAPTKTKARGGALNAPLNLAPSLTAPTATPAAPLTVPAQGV